MKAPAWRRWVPRVLLVFGALLTIVACLGVWAQRQLMNTENWVDTSSALLRDKAVQEETAAYLSDQVASSVTADELAAKLPDRLKPFAPQAASALSELAERVATRALQSGAFQTLWEATNRTAHEQFVKLVNGDKTTLLGRSVVLDLRPMLGKLAGRIGLGPDFAAKLSGDQGRVQIVKESDIDSLRKAFKVLKTVAWWAAFLAILTLGSAVSLSIPERRRNMLMTVGFTVAGAALFVLVVRRVAGNSLIQTVSDGGASEPAARSTWTIATTMLQHIAQATFVLGLVIAAAAWFAGPARWPVRARKWIAPVVRDHGAAVWGSTAIVILLVLAWAPLPAMRSALGAAFFAFLLGGGLWALQRQISREFPAP